jgi:hypothetical protein
MTRRSIIAGGVLACLLGAPALSWAQFSGVQIPGGLSLSKDTLLQQAKGLLADLTSMKSSGTLPAEQGKKVDELLPKAQSLNDELEKPQLSAARLPELASNLNDLQKQVSLLKTFVR